jgi:putative membrane protein
MRTLRIVDWALFVLVAYFIVGDITYQWLALPLPGDMGFVPAFTAFSVLHAGLRLGGWRVVLFFGLTVVISFIAEETGVLTGLVFGHYHYSAMLGWKLGEVPILVPLGWFMMIYPSWVVAQSLLQGVDLRRPLGMIVLALVSALTMTGWDMVMDPPMAAAHNWVWEDGGPYFGVPLHNYVGWVGNTFVIFLVFGIVDRLVSKRQDAPYRFDGVFAALPVAIYCLFSLQYLAPYRMPALRVIAVFSMLMPGMLALARLVLPAERQTASKPIDT